MTVSDLLRLSVRHWVVSLLVLACIAAGGLWATQQHAAYNGRVSVMFLAPSATDGNVLAGTTFALVATTGIVAGQVNGPAPQSQTVGDVTLSSTGVATGWSVRQPNNGGQWVVHFSDPLLDVRSTGPTLGAAQEQMQIALTKVDTALAELQDDADVPDDARISTLLSPLEPVYTVQSGSRVRTMGGVALLGILTWAGALLAADKLRPARARRERIPAHV
jgi:hypothetical protein